MSVAVLGRRIGPRRAAVAGAVLGTLPDLDVLVPFDNPVDEFVLHRGATHSLFVHVLATPVLGEVLLRLDRGLRDHRALTYLAVFLCLATHALLDAMTVYGTRLLWPLWPEPLGLGSVFIIDPLYTLPLLVLTIWALCLRAWTPRFGTAVIACLAVSTAYLGWSLGAQQLAAERATETLAAHGVKPERQLAIPTPFNTLLWRVIAVDGTRYLNIYVPLLAAPGSMTIYSHVRGTERFGCLDEIPDAKKLARFSKGFYRIDQEGDQVVVSDLRMGLTPGYVFRFGVARLTRGRLEQIPSTRRPVVREMEGDVPWLLAGMAGDTAQRPQEAMTRLSVVALSPSAETSLGC